MIRSLFLILALAAGWSAQAQTEKRIIPKSQQQAAEQRKTDKRLEEIQDSIDYAKAVQALENLEFVVEADQLVFKRGQSAFVSSSTNFISMHDDKTVVQVAPFNGGGPNGVGGVTVEGRASDIKLKTDKRGNTYFTMNVLGNGISAMVTISMAKGSNRASVTVNPNFNSNRITLNGILIPAEESRVFKGRAF
ncbi:DUF4251 domain-containing protein [uncultured Alistipes sp.]|jgi:hypothetical protein|uniref:DUF4251 domain-containing protein n=1 Tax=uncultured Alistipes sp. TaxID=538949 RepID=UPI002665E4D7|nr:DUF4251 domain-containing protein [uncultured Alistipes sp.]